MSGGGDSTSTGGNSRQHRHRQQLMVDVEAAVDGGDDDDGSEVPQVALAPSQQKFSPTTSRRPHRTKTPRPRLSSAMEQNHLVSTRSRRLRHISSFDYEDAARVLTDGKAVVFSVTIYHLGGINPQHQSFFADIGIHMSWQEPTLESRAREAEVTQLELDDPDVHIPELFINNRLDVNPVNVPVLTMRRRDPEGVVRWEQRYSGTFLEMLHLRYFPFGEITITITIITRRVLHVYNVLPPPNIRVRVLAHIRTVRALLAY